MDFHVAAEAGMLDDSPISRVAKANCEKSFAPSRKGLEKLEYAVQSLTKGSFMFYVEKNLLQLSKRARRCLSHYGAQNGLSAGYCWETKSHDATNVIYAGVWEAWKDAEHFQAYPRCRNITSVNNAGNTMKGVLGVARLQVYERGDIASEAVLRRRLAHDEMHTYMGVAAEVFNFLCSYGSEPVRWVRTLEVGLEGYTEVCNACPWIQCTTKGYNYVRQRRHIDALQLGFPSGSPFIRLGLDPHPREYWSRYPPDVQDPDLDLDLDLALVKKTK
jgi:hypothetical protein